MLTILLYVLCYIGAAYAYMAVPCFIWYKYGRSMEANVLSFGLFVMAPVSWPIATLGWLLDGWCWLWEKASRLLERD